MSDALVVDTHVWIWFMEGMSEIKPQIRKLLSSRLQDNRILIPSICVWEVGMLCKKSRLHLSKPVAEWVRQGLRMQGLRLVPLSEEIAVEATNLPGAFHSDPADCMIVATARIENASLLTRDSRIISYGNAGHVKVLAV